MLLRAELKRGRKIFRNDDTIRWHQRIQIGDWVSPGVHDVHNIFIHSSIPDDLSGKSCLDVGTTNGAAALELARRGGTVTATDICGPEVFGFTQITQAAGYEIEFVTANAYNLPSILQGRKFDIVLFWGVFYHLRHPLLAMDSIFQVCNGTLSLETEVSDFPFSGLRFYRLDQLAGDGSNWFTPTKTGLEDIFVSSGFEASNYYSWGDRSARRALIEGKVKDETPEFMQVSYERQIEEIRFSRTEPRRLA